MKPGRARLPCAARKHPEQHAVATDEMMMERGRGVQPGQSKQAVGQHLMNLLRGMKHARIGSDAKVQLGETVVEGAAMPDIGDDPENRKRTIST
jgi:hypothetical protein